MSEYKGSCLNEWMKWIKEKIVPPLCVEIFLINNCSYFLSSVAYWEDDDPTVVLQIWDLRAMGSKRGSSLEISHLSSTLTCC